jgi:hypothetical protein
VGALAALLFEQALKSILDQQNQTLNQHDGSHARGGECQGLACLVVTTYKPRDLHDQSSIKSIGCRDLLGLRGWGTDGGHGAKPLNELIWCGSYHLVGLPCFDVDQCPDCDCIVVIMGRAFAGAVVFLPYLRAT